MFFTSPSIALDGLGIFFIVIVGIVVLICVITGLVVLGLSMTKPRKRKDRIKDGGADSGEEGGKSKKPIRLIEVAAGWVDFARKHPLAVPIHILWGWWLAVLMPLLLGGSDDQLWVFLYQKHFWLTFFTPFFAMAIYFLIKAKNAVLVSLSIIITLVLCGYWYGAIDSEEWRYFSANTDGETKTKSSAVVQKKATIYKTLSEFTASQDEWTAPYYPPTDKESGGGFYIHITGPVSIRTTYHDKVTEMIRRPGDKDGVGKAEKLEFRAIGNEPVRVKITIKVRER